MKKKEKKGQSNIISTVLIILIVLVSVTIIWNIVGGVIKQSVKQVDIGILAVSTEIKSGSVFVNQTSKELQFDLNRRSDKSNLSGFKVILICEDKTIKGYFVEFSQILLPLETKTYYLSGFECNVTEINVYPISLNGNLGPMESYKISNYLQDKSPSGDWDKSITILSRDDTGTCQKINYYLDSDLDGFGNSTISQLNCTQPTGYVSNNADCDDNEFDIKPSATENCYNNIDDNCDGTTDCMFNGLVAWWRMDDVSGSTVIDVLGKNNGTISGASQISGLFGQGMKLDGYEDYINLGNVDEFEFRDNFTIAGWYYVKGVHDRGNSNSAGTVISKYRSYSLDRQWVISVNPEGKLNFYTSFDGTSPETLFTDIYSSNQWIHFTAIMNNTHKSIYMNGIKVNDSNSGGVFSGTYAKTIIGAMDYSSTSYDNEFNGTLDEIMVFNKALNLTEIQALAYHP